MRISRIPVASPKQVDAFLTSMADQAAEYAADNDNAFYESLPPHEWHDAGELHEMQQHQGYNPETCRVEANDNVSLSVNDDEPKTNAVDDVREEVRENRGSVSQAPPSLSEDAKKALNNYRYTRQIKNETSRVTYAEAIRLVDRGFACIPVHTLDPDGHCTCQWKRKQDAALYDEIFEQNCTAPGKHPKLAKWQNRAGTTIARIQKWYSLNSNRLGPTNLGIVTGKDKGVVVIDVDGPEGLNSLARMEHEWGLLPATITTITGSGGRHLLFRYPTDWEISNSVSILGGAGSKVDVRGDNGFIVAPGSVHKSGNSYQWLAGHSPDDLALADLPLRWVQEAHAVTKAHQVAQQNEIKDNTATIAAKQDTTSKRGVPLSFENIGDHVGGSGFNSPINTILTKYFFRYGADADCSDLVQEISDYVERLIADNRVDGSRSREVYTIKGGKLLAMVESARKYVTEHSSKLPYGFAIGKEANEGYIGYFKKEGDEKNRFVPVCSKFEVLGKARTEDGDGWGLVLQFTDADNVTKDKFISRADLLADPKIVRRALSDAGMTIRPREAPEFDKLLGDLESDVRILLAHSPGWQKDGTFITPNGSLIGGEDEQRIILDNVKAGTESGTLDGAIAVMNAALHTGADHIALAPMAGIAGCLLDFCELPSIVVAYTGTTSRGKTTSLELSVSMWTRPTGDKNSLLTSMRSTSNGMESILVASNGTVAAIDEMQLCEGRELHILVFMIASGEAKARATQDGRGRRKSYWTTCAVLSGEIGVAEKISQAGAVVAGGVAARVIEVDVSEAKTLDASTLEQLAARREHFGHLGPRFAHHISKHYNPGQLRDRITEVATSLTTVTSDPLARRIASAYSVLLVAGALLQEADLLDRNFDMTEFFQGLMARHLVEVTDPVENAVRTLQASVVSAKDVSIKVFGEEGYREADGWYDNDNCEFICIRADKIPVLSGGAVKPSAVVKRLDRNGHLLRQGKNLSWESLPAGGLSVGGKVKHYRIRRECFWGS